MQKLRFLFAMALLYMFRVTISPIIRSTMLYMATGELAIANKKRNCCILLDLFHQYKLLKFSLPFRFPDQNFMCSYLPLQCMPHAPSISFSLILSFNNVWGKFKLIKDIIYKLYHFHVSSSILGPRTSSASYFRTL